MSFQNPALFLEDQIVQHLPEMLDNCPYKTLRRHFGIHITVEVTGSNPVPPTRKKRKAGSYSIPPFAFRNHFRLISIGRHFPKNSAEHVKAQRPV
jgi:hypothetical protein